MPKLEIVTGARAGAAFRLRTERVAVGRAGDADLRFDPDLDRAVSARHALIFRHDGRWYVRDEASRNGTFVNGRSVTGDAPLNDGDRIEFGAGGPAAVFHVDGDALSATGRLRQIAARQSRRLLLVSAGSVALLIALVAGFLLHDRRQRAEFDDERAAWTLERDAMRLRIDNILAAADATVRSLEGEVAGLAAALARSRGEVSNVRDALALAESSGDTTNVPELRRQLQSATAALERQQLAASLDFRAIEAANRRAVAMVYVEAADGVVSTGSAFAIRADGTLATARHVLIPLANGPRPRRIAVQFSDSEQAWPARLLAVSADADIAIIKVDNILGDVPTVRGLNLRSDTLGAGTPVAVIGFPLGGDAVMPGSAHSERLARPLPTAGVVTRLTAGGLEVQGYGAAGASGSPIFDRDGNVIAVLYGGRRDNGGSVIFGAPAAHIARIAPR